MSDDMDRMDAIEGEQVALDSLEADVANLNMSAVARATVGELHADSSAIGLITASEGAAFSRSGVGVVAASGDVAIDQGGAAVVLAEGGVSISQGGAEWIIATGDVSVDRGGAGVVVGRSVSVNSGWVGVVAASDAQIAEGTTIVFGKPVTLALGIGIGAALAALIGIIVYANSREG